jgi:hypothetical protein
VHDHLGVVHAALAEPDEVVLVPEVRGVDAILADADVVRPLQDRAKPVAEAEGLKVLLGFVHPEVAHHLLELVLVAGVEELGVRAVRRGAGAGAHVRPRAPEVAGPVEVPQRDRRVEAGRQLHFLAVLAVLERLVPRGLHGVDHEDAGGAEDAADPHKSSLKCSYDPDSPPDILTGNRLRGQPREECPP